jgi:ribosome-associated protein
MGSIVNKDRPTGLLRELAGRLEEHKGEETVILDLTAECSFTDYFIITTAQSGRHLASLVGYARDVIREHGVSVQNRVMPQDDSGWALIDGGWFVVHVMGKTERAFYELEKLWFRALTIDYSSKSS